jgi:oligopeptide transport system substrate-binding protein
MENRTLILKVLLMTFMIFSMIGCAKKESEVSKKGFLRVSLSTPISSLDPRIGVERPSTNIIRMLYEGLMTRGPNGELINGLAEKIKVSEDKKTYTFYLRPSCWSNGDPVTAYDFEYAWKKSINIKTAKLGAFHFNCIKNALRCLEGKASIHEVGINALNDHILVVELENPVPYFLELTACTTYSPLPHKMMQSDMQWPHVFKEPLVSNGPFSLKTWSKGKFLILEKNFSYWDADVVKIPGIYFFIEPEASIRHFMFDQKKIDWMGYPLSPLSSDAIEDCQKKYKVEISDSHNILWFFINTKHPPFHNKNLRKALAFAIDRKTITQHLHHINYEPTFRVIKRNHFGEQSHCFCAEDQVRAQLYFNSALSELGMEHHQFPEIILSYYDRGVYSKIAPLVQNQWEKNLGIKVKLDPLSKERLFSQMYQGKFQFCGQHWCSLIEDPIYMLDLFRSGQGNINISHWVNGEYRKLLIESDREQNPEKRQKLMLEAEKILLEEMPIIPICYGAALYMKQENLETVSVSPLMEINFKYATFVDK